ncbi:hypothetical protein [Paraburkholderia kirstenboschensis]|uniref:hypothetical protein n=1 Tax=Paraburkholderia kirstenboschensis TaxID=1245436 RepID=UPI001FB356BD|nr:hypothetical protein [Paraburkholderia kirstenboschensis]
MLLPPEPPKLAPGIVHSNFSVQGDARHSFLAWQERMNPVYDIQAASKHGDETFDAALSRYTIDNLSFRFPHQSQSGRAVAGTSVDGKHTRR